MSDKKRYIFQTGHGKGLARAEILALLPDSIVDEVNDGFVVEADLQNAPALLNRMGGIVRITETLRRGPKSVPLNFSEWINNAIRTEMKDITGKIRYGVSMHPKSDKILKKILIDSKSVLKGLGNLRFINKDFQNLSSVQAWHERLLEPNAIELHLFASEEYWYLSKTLAIQDFEWYSHRDYNRPAKSAKNGMFPPKLAQMLINIAQTEGTVYDPFCGSGTVLQEAWLMGFTASGSDISEETLENCAKNLLWLQKEAHLETPLPHLFQADATQLSKNELPEDPFSIVTETWLGPLLTHVPSTSELQKIQKEVEKVYEVFFSNLKRLLKKPITMVFTAPYHHEGNLRHFLPHLPKILTKYTEIVPLSDHERPSLFYERKGQLVSREIWKVIIKN